MFEVYPFVTGSTLTLRIRRARTRDTRGQALVEFALVLPILVLIMLGVMQFGVLFWSQITLTQIARDTGRWVSTQTWTCAPVDGTAATQVATQANLIANRSTLFAWSASNQITLASGPTYTMIAGTGVCPPDDNQEVWNVSFELSHTVPVFIPFVATNGCAGGCERDLTSEVQFRMEPAP
jgi:hypothetical protein